MIPVNSVLEVGHFPEMMQAEINRRFTPVLHPDPAAPAPEGHFEAILVRSNITLPETLLRQIPSIRMVSTCGVGMTIFRWLTLKSGESKSATPQGFSMMLFVS